MVKTVLSASTVKMVLTVKSLLHKVKQVLMVNDGKDGKTKTRIVYEKPNGDKEEVATLNDGLKFTGNNEVENSHKLNSLVTIKR